VSKATRMCTAAMLFRKVSVRAYPSPLRPETNRMAMRVSRLKMTTNPVQVN